MKIFKRVVLLLLGTVALALFAFFMYYLIITSSVKLDVSRLVLSQNEITVYDGEDSPYSECSKVGKRTVAFDELPNHLVNAFLTAEDKGFFTHRGLDYKRMAMAIWKNVRSLSFKEGASTISQQLVKNTQLTSEKTIGRKLKEIKLTRELERKYSKEEILEMYLNTIYFGHSCFGLASACEFYFNLSPSELSPAQSAMLAGMVRSPNNYSPLKNPEKCVRRRNFILKKMKESGFLDEESFALAKKESVPTDGFEERGKSRSFIAAVLDEYEEMTDQAVYGGVKIFTYLDGDLQEKLESLSEESQTDKSFVVVGANTRGVKAFYSTVGQAKRLPGSTFKPLLVYAPALEEDILSPATPVLDEKIDYAGYSPKNADGKYHGYVSAREALAESYNIPAVKILNGLGLSKALPYVRKMGFSADKEDGLSLALGGMKEGYSLPALCGGYAVFPNGGIYSPVGFIRKIETNDKRILYERKEEKVRVFSEETTTLMNDMLRSAVKSGTAKRLKSLPYTVCAKTGTCGGAAGNTDAYCLAYTAQDIVGVWLGNADYSEMNISGGGSPANINAEILKYLYENGSPSPLARSKNVKEYLLDKREYEENHRLILCDDNAPLARKTLKEVFKIKNAPAEKSTYFSHPALDHCKISVQEGTVLLELCQAEYLSMIVNRQGTDGFVTVYQGKVVERLQDDSVIAGEKYTYSVTPYYEKFVGDTIILPQTFIGNQ